MSSPSLNPPTSSHFFHHTPPPGLLPIYFQIQSKFFEQSSPHQKKTFCSLWRQETSETFLFTNSLRREQTASKWTLSIMEHLCFLQPCHSLASCQLHFVSLVNAVYTVQQMQTSADADDDAEREKPRGGIRAISPVKKKKGGGCFEGGSWIY